MVILQLIGLAVVGVVIVAGLKWLGSNVKFGSARKRTTKK